MKNNGFILTLILKRLIFCAAMRRNHNPKSGAADMSKTKLLFVGIVCIAFSNIASAIVIPEPNKPNLNSDSIVNFVDYAIFAQNWLATGAGLTGDFDDSNSVDYNDLFVIAYYWLKGPPPQKVFEQLKTTLSSSDVNAAVLLFADSVSYEYSVIFNELKPVLPIMAEGMGELSLTSFDGNIARYEMLHDEGGGVIASFPVYFCKDANDNWKIYCF